MAYCSSCYPQLWYAVDRAALTAVRERGRSSTAAPSRSTPAHSFLETAERQEDQLPAAAGGRGERRQHVTFLDSTAGLFKECRNGDGAYGGLWTENVVSGIARDLLAGAMLRIEAPAIRL
jgi:hypothetical protein